MAAPTPLPPSTNGSSVACIADSQTIPKAGGARSSSIVAAKAPIAMLSSCRN
jgi:hypothetical protein